MCHVLIIEDEWHIAEILIELAEEAGGTSFVTALTEDEAIAAARARTPTHHFFGRKIPSVHGARAVQTIMAEAGEIPVIFITGSPADCKPCNPPGVILCKPIQRQLVVDTFRQPLHLRMRHNLPVRSHS